MRLQVSFCKFYQRIMSTIFLVLQSEKYLRNQMKSKLMHILESMYMEKKNLKISLKILVEPDVIALNLKEELKKTDFFPWNWNVCFILIKLKWPFYFGQNEMSAVHFGQNEMTIPFWQKWNGLISFWPKWNGHFILAKMKWSFHFGQNEMEFISFCPEWNDYFILAIMKCHFFDSLKKYASRGLKTNIWKLIGYPPVYLYLV